MARPAGDRVDQACAKKDRSRRQNQDSHHGIRLNCGRDQGRRDDQPDRAGKMPCKAQHSPRKITGQDALKELEVCKMAQLYQLTLDCGASFTNELYKLTRVALFPFSGPREPERAAARARISKSCDRPLG